jgi:hypothetical protein
MPLTWTRHLTCPKCGGQFDYEFVPGASLTAIRLGTSRYMRCPLCHRFAIFSLRAPKDQALLAADTTAPSDSGGGRA